MDYNKSLLTGMRAAVADMISDVASGSLDPDFNELYITFFTSYEGVSVPDFLRAKYPDNITIVLQHEFRDLSVDDEGFSVTLSFSGRATPLYIPFASVMKVADSIQKFGIDLSPFILQQMESASVPKAASDAPDDRQEDEGAEEDGDDNVIRPTFGRK